jgi:hypothetical protein
MQSQGSIPRVNLCYLVFAVLMLCLSGAFQDEAGSATNQFDFDSIELSTQYLTDEESGIRLSYEAQSRSLGESSPRWHWDNPRPQGNPLRGIWGNSATNVFAVGEGGMILHYDGKAWKKTTSGTTNDFNGVWGSSAADVFAVGNPGTILHYKVP